MLLRQRAPLRSTRGNAATSRRAIVRARASVASVPLASNPLHRPDVAGLQLLRTSDGAAVPVGEATQGKVVVGFLRHLGCPFCWEQAETLRQLQPQFSKAGFRLIVISVGSPEGGRKVCESLPFPQDLLFLDPDRAVYKALNLSEGLRAFFSDATKEAMAKKDFTQLKAILKRYTLVNPPNLQSTLQMGGVYVMDGDTLLYARQDKGVGDHAPVSDVLAACGLAA